MKNKKWTIDGRRIIMVAMGMLLLPNIIFILGWIYKRYSIAIVCLCLLGYVFFCKKIRKMELPVFQIKTSVLFEILIATCFFIWICGIGGYFPQYYDWIVRNPIYRDLIFESWPVIYEQTGRGMCYYIGFWLLPAAITKLLGKVGNFDNATLWNIGNGVLYVWSVFFLFTIFLLILLKATKKGGVEHKDWRKTFLIFAGFGGAACIGFLISEFAGYVPSEWYNTILIEHWSSIVGLVNSNYIVLSNVFNQGLYAWLAALIFILLEDEYRFFGLIVGALFISGPFPTLGLGLLMVGKVVELLIQKKISIKKLFSMENIAIIPIVLVVGLYYIGRDDTHLYVKHFFGFFGFGKAIAAFLLTVVLTYGIYSLVVWKKHKSFFFVWLNISIAFLFCFSINGGIDFSARTILPAYFIIMVYVIEYVNEEFVFINKRNTILIGMICFSYVTFFISILSNVEVILENGTLIVPYDSPEVYTFRDKHNKEDLDLIEQYTKRTIDGDWFYDYLCNCTVDKFPYIDAYEEDGTPKTEAVYMNKAMEDEVLATIADVDRENAYIQMEDALDDENYRKIVFEAPIALNKCRNYDITGIDATVYCSNMPSSIKSTKQTTEINLWVTNNGTNPIYSSGLVDNAWFQIGALLVDENGTIYETNIGRSNIDEIIWPGQSFRIPFEISLDDVEGNEVYDTENLYVKFCWVYTTQSGADLIETFADFSNVSSYQIKIK